MTGRHDSGCMCRLQTSVRSKLCVIKTQVLTFLVFETAATEVDDFDGTLGRMPEEDVLMQDKSGRIRRGSRRHTSGFKSQCTIR